MPQVRRAVRSCARRLVLICLVVRVAACSGDGADTSDPSDSDTPADTDPALGPDGSTWTIVAEDLGGAVLSVAGSAWDDVWVVGSDDGSGPLVGHRGADGWERVATGSNGDLWWVWQPPAATGPASTVWAVGSDGRVLRFDGAAWSEEVLDPGLTLFGVWGASEDEVWAVGGDTQQDGEAAIYRWDGASWSSMALPGAAAGEQAVYKVWGATADDVWACGTGGLLLRWDGAAWSEVESGTDQLLLTVAGDAPDNVFAVGGFGNARVLHHDGAAWVDESPEFVTDMNGVSTRGGRAVIVGRTGAVYLRGDGGGWTEDPRGRPVFSDLHGAWIDPDGAVWAVGGAFASLPMSGGVVVYGGRRPVGAWTP